MQTDSTQAKTSQERSSSKPAVLPKTRLVFPSGINVALLSNHHKTLTCFASPSLPARPSSAQGHVSTLQDVHQDRMHKEFHCPFLQDLVETISQCLSACPLCSMRVPTCLHVRMCVRGERPRECASETAVYFTRRCSWCLASGPCHDPWHCQWLTSSAHCATASTLSLHSSTPPRLHTGLVFFLCLFFFLPLYTHANII